MMIRTHVLGFLFLLLSFATLGQRSDQEIETLIKRGAHQGGFFAFSFKGTEIHNEPALLAGARIGWTIDRVVALGLEAHGLVPSVTQPYGAFDDKVRPLLGYGGIFAEPIIGSNRSVHLTFPLFLGGGWAGYIDDWNNDNPRTRLRQDAIIWVAEPGANIEINLTQWMRLGLGVSYRAVNGMDKLEEEFGERFQGMNYNFMLKLGRF